MKTLKAFEERYTTKLYDPNNQLDYAVIEQLKAILRLSPSSINSQPWHFTFVESYPMRQQLAEHSWFNDRKVLDSSAIVVFSAANNVEKFEQWLNETQPQGAIDYYVNFVQPRGKDEIEQWFVSQTYLSVGVLLSACAVMGVDATPMEGFDNEKYDEILRLEDYKSVVVVAVGKRDPDDFNQPSRSPKSRRAMSDVVKTIK